MAEEIFIRISLTILVAVIVAGGMRLLKQPLLIGYILTGIIVGPTFLNLLEADTTLNAFGKIGVALLLFTVGLHLNPKVIKEVGKVSLITGVGQVVFTSIIGFLISRLLGFSTIVSLYIAVALTFSSTIIIMKLLSDKEDLNTVYGKISIGFLIVQDLIAIFALMFISSLSTGGTLSIIGTTFVKGILAIFALGLVSIAILPHVMKFVARSQEFLFLFSMAWCLALASLFFWLNFSLEIGALFAGVALSISPYSNEISSKLKPLRDFFIVAFFIVIGSQMVLGDITTNLFSIIFFSVFILIGNPLIVMAIMGHLGYTKRSGFLAGLTVAQISEFSIILATLGVSVGHLSREVLSLITVVGLITIAGSTYMIMYSNQLYNFLAPYLKVFERKTVREKKKLEKSPKAILFGYNRIGFGILNSLKKIKKDYLVIDYDPDTIADLTKWRIPALYGDIYDMELLDELPLDKIQLAVSTIPDFETNTLLIQEIRKKNKKAIIIVRAHQIKEALDLYRKGANYVLTPHFLGGEYVAKMIRGIKTDKKGYREEKTKHVEMLEKIKEAGKEHPGVEKG
ncbi:MAG: cation:proton antiporter [Candidatus Nanoarchaeia archaeon]